MPNDIPEQVAQAVIDGCADCDVCRYLMEHTPCMFFPQLYRLYDEAAAQKQQPYAMCVMACELAGDSAGNRPGRTSDVHRVRMRMS